MQLCTPKLLNKSDANPVLKNIVMVKYNLLLLYIHVWETWDNLFMLITCMQLC